MRITAGAMPAPDPLPQNGHVEHFRLPQGDQGSPNGKRSHLDSLAASKLTAHHLDLTVSNTPFHSNGEFPSTLQAIPLASYYKLHRVPSLSNMAEMPTSADAGQDVKLPRRESTASPGGQPAPANGIHNKVLEQVVRTPGRQPSPQPTHLSVPGSSNHTRILQDDGSGYVAPKFEGKEAQMDQGEFCSIEGRIVELHIYSRY